MDAVKMEVSTRQLINTLFHYLYELLFCCIYRRSICPLNISVLDVGLYIINSRVQPNLLGADSCRDKSVVCISGVYAEQGECFVLRKNITNTRLCLRK